MKKEKAITTEVRHHVKEEEERQKSSAGKMKRQKVFCQNVCPKFDLSNVGNIHKKKGFSLAKRAPVFWNKL